MLIPSIDLMGGKVVQLVQGKKKALEFDDAEEWISRFSKYPLVQLIDLDAAMGTGSNGALVSKIAGRLPCQVGGGIRTLQAAEEMLASGAHRAIIGSALFAQGEINQAFVENLAATVGPGPSGLRPRREERKGDDSWLAEDDRNRATASDSIPRSLV